VPASSSSPRLIWASPNRSRERCVFTASSPAPPRGRPVVFGWRAALLGLYLKPPPPPPLGGYEGRMRWRMGISYLIENREAAVGVQMFHMRQRWRAAVWRAQTQVLLGREAEVCSTGVGGGRVAPCSGRGDKGQLEVTRQWVWRRRGTLRGYQLGCWVRRRRLSRRQAVERLGERRRLRAWSGPARGRPVVFFLGGRVEDKAREDESREVFC
jgi:hypothetical protein